MAQRSRHSAKQVVYLFGAGATQAEVDHLGARPVNLLMRDDDRLGEGLSTRILARTGVSGNRFRALGHGVDVEKLISLLAASGVDRLSRLADKMRRLYFEEIRLCLVESEIIDRPGLAMALLELHNDARFSGIETVTGLITTNHDGLLQVASQKALGGIAVGFPFISSNFTPANPELAPLILQLHGSFSWRFGVPATIDKLGRETRYSPDTRWIPPSVLKESKEYPFNKLIGLAYELLSKRCDVLRVIGASLTQNDWNIISLIFHAQRHRELSRGAAFRVELIMSQPSGQRTVRECSYLRNLTPIGHLTEGDFSEYKEPELAPDSEKQNAFAYWLKEKIRFHLRRDEVSHLSNGSNMALIVGEAP